MLDDEVAFPLPIGPVEQLEPPSVKFVEHGILEKFSFSFTEFETECFSKSGILYKDLLLTPQNLVIGEIESGYGMDEINLFHVTEIIIDGLKGEAMSSGESSWAEKGGNVGEQVPHHYFQLLVVGVVPLHQILVYDRVKVILEDDLSLEIALCQDHLGVSSPSKELIQVPSC